MKHHGRQDGGAQADRKVDRRLGREPHIVGNPIFRVPVIAGHEVQLIVAAIPEPTVEEMVRQPERQRRCIVILAYIWATATHTLAANSGK